MELPLQVSTARDDGDERHLVGRSSLEVLEPFLNVSREPYLDRLVTDRDEVNDG